jgi:hypothetical protein
MQTIGGKQGNLPSPVCELGNFAYILPIFGTKSFKERFPVDYGISRNFTMQYVSVRQLNQNLLCFFLFACAFYFLFYELYDHDHMTVPASNTHHVQ